MKLLDMAQFRTLKDLQEFTETLYKTNLGLQNDVKLKQEKIEHLETLLNTLPTNNLLVDDKEIEICKIEINRLYQLSCRMPLDDKQVRNLEILVRTLATAKGKSVGDEKVKQDKNTTKNMPIGQLISLAKQIKDQ